MTKPVKRNPPKPRNAAAKALREGQFQPRVEDDPKAYRRRPKHKQDVSPAADDEEENRN